jgi:signal peptidase I
VTATPRPGTRRIVSIFTLLAMIGALLLAAILILPTLLGYERYVIVSGSMEPTIPVGAVIYDEVVPVDDIETGDVITFVPPSEYGIDDPVTHRVIRISVAGDNTSHPGERIFETQCDANDDPDAWQMMLDGPDQARYVRHLPYVGYVYMALQVRWVQLLVIGIPAIILIAYIIVTLWRLSGEAVREERQREQEPDQQDHEHAEPVP